MSLELASSSPDVRVTALCSFKDGGSRAILAALGGVLEMYVDHGKKVNGSEEGELRRSDSASILKGEVIHELFTSEGGNNDVFVFGGKQVARVEVDVVGGRIGQILWRNSLEDWIVSCVELDGDNLVALTAHNRLIYFPSREASEKHKGFGYTVYVYADKCMKNICYSYSRSECGL